MGELWIFALLSSFFLFFAIIGIILYLLAAFGLFTMAKNQNIENAFIAWIPIAQLYILGILIRNLNIFDYEVPQIELALPALAIAGSILSPIPLIGQLIGIVAFVVNMFALHKLFSMYRPTQANLYIIISVFLPFMGPVFIFLMRNDRVINDPFYKK